MTVQSNYLYDFRSDTITKPSREMRLAMADAAVGDDYYGEDPTVRLLEERTAEIFDKESAILNTSGTQSNLIAVMSHCNRGDAYIVGDQSHSYTCELGGVASLASVLPQVATNQSDGTIKIDELERLCKLDGLLAAPCRLLALENTIGGKVLPMDWLQRATNLARANGLACHLDGARVFNAAAAYGVDIQEISQQFDTVSVCLSKGLGAPAGSLLAGSKKMIDMARRHRQALGGGMRQSGILAAAGLYALEHNVSRLTKDHDRAQKLAEALMLVTGVTVEQPQTNMVFVNVEPTLSEQFSQFLKGVGIGYSGCNTRQRWVTHLDINDDALAATIASISKFSTEVQTHV